MSLYRLVCHFVLAHALLIDAKGRKTREVRTSSAFFVYAVRRERLIPIQNPRIDNFSTVGNDTHHDLSGTDSVPPHKPKCLKDITFFQPSLPQTLLFCLEQRCEMFSLTSARYFNPAQIVANKRFDSLMTPCKVLVSRTSSSYFNVITMSVQHNCRAFKPKFAKRLTLYIVIPMRSSVSRLYIAGRTMYAFFSNSSGCKLNTGLISRDRTR